jgi:integrase/recombinase XerD
MTGRTVSKRHAVPTPQTPTEDRFLAYMAAEGLSPETIRQRVYLLRGLGKDPADITAADIVALINNRDLSQSSKATYITVLRATFADLIRAGIVDADPLVTLRTPRTPRRRPRPITEEELARLESMEESRPRAYAFTILGAYAGLRISEVLALRGTWLTDTDHGPVLRVTGKGGVTAEVPAHPKVIRVLEPFVDIDEPLWPIWPQNAIKSWKRGAKSVGVTGRTFHQLRHTFATRLTRQGVPLLVVADLCRHASVATTQRYAAVADDAPFAAIVGL